MARRTSRRQSRPIPSECPLRVRSRRALGRCECPLQAKEQTLNCGSPNSSGGSLLAQSLSLFAIKNSLFQSQGIRPKKSLASMGLVQRGGGFRPKFPVFSCRSGNFRERRLVRCSLSAQPPSRGYSGSPPAVAGRSPRSPEIWESDPRIMSRKKSVTPEPRQSAVRKAGNPPSG